MLQEGDIVFNGPKLSPVRIVRLEEHETDEIVFDLQVEAAHSFITEACVVHNCGASTVSITG